jgi:hypothetical protein
MGAEENQIEASFCAAIRTAKEQKSVSLEKRAEATYAEYRRQKASGSGGRAFRLPLFLASWSALALGLVVENPQLSNKRLRCKASTPRLQEIR